MRKKEKYIIYVHQEYLHGLYQSQAAETMEQQEAIRYELYNLISRWLRGDTTQVTIMFDTFINSKGEKTRGVEIYNLSKCARIKNPKELKRLSGKQESRSFIELKEKEEQS